MRYIRSILMVIALSCLLQVASAAPKTFIQPSSSTVANGSTFTVDVIVDPLDSEITSARYTLQFDNARIRAISLTQGPFLKQSGEDTEVDPYLGINNTAGIVEYGEFIKALPDNDTEGVRTQGTLSSITFEAVCDDVAGNLNFTYLEMAEVFGRDAGNTRVRYLYTSDINGYNGSYTICQCPRGDLNGDCSITSADVAIALQMAVRGGYDPLPDLNGDYSVTSLDALMIMQQLEAYPVMTVSEQPTGLAVGDTFTADVTVDPAGAEIYAAQYDLYFNSTILRAIGQIQGDFLGQDDAKTHVVLNTINNTIGKIEYGETRLVNPKTVGGATATGVLASINFEVIGAGLSTLTLSDMKCVTPDDLIDSEPTLEPTSNDGTDTNFDAVDSNRDSSSDSSEHIPITTPIAIPPEAPTESAPPSSDDNGIIEDHGTTHIYIVESVPIAAPLAIMGSACCGDYVKINR